LPRLPSARIDAGKVNEFWTLVAPLLSDADLAGSYLFAGHEQAEAIFNLMQKAVDIEKLSKESDVPMTAENQFYHKTLSDFVSSQRNRQHVTITSNPGRLLTDTIVRQHTLALEQALGQDLHATLSPALLCTWHGMLCDEQSHAGVVRPIHVAVRVGYTTFQPSHQVGADLEQLCHLLGALESRLVSTPSLSPSIASMTYAAAVFFSIADLHAFADGNGRLARIAANWALRRFGVPFCVPMFATLEERKEYISAILFTRRNLYIVARGEVLQESLLEVYRNEGCLLPLILLFMNRLYKSVTDFNRLLADQSRTLSDFDDMTGRRFRKRAADGICLM
jgi:fido (protein-threonine AMPylation protein)